MSTTHERPLIGSVVERTPSAALHKFVGKPGTGFPNAQHRFKSAFARARDEANTASKKPQDQQPVARTVEVVNPKPIPTDTDALLRQIHEENARTIARMSEGEIQQEKRAVLEQLGEGTERLLRRVQEARRRKEAAGRSVPSPLSEASSTRPSSRASQRLRFAEVTPEDVHVYESAPVSPKRAAIALPPPPDNKDDSIVSLRTFGGGIRPKRLRPTAEPPSALVSKDDEPEEGTPEDIRRRFFPNVPASDPSLAWMESSSSGATDPSAPRFDLQGFPIPTSLSNSLPSHLGLHHHAEGAHAGYTIDDLFLLSRSTVPAQRASMLGVLAKVAHRLGQQVRRTGIPETTVVFAGEEGEIRKRIISAGLAAVGQIGSLGARAVEVVWECLVEWDGVDELEGAELVLAPDLISSLQLDNFLPLVADVLSQAVLPDESLAQLLAVVHRLAQESNSIAESITTTPRLVSAIFSTFLLTPIPPKETSRQPNPLALQSLITLASASRSNASALVDPADALLRFVTLLPPSSPYTSDLAFTLLTDTLRLYTTLASYGLYSHIATTASQVFNTLASYIHTASSSSTDTSGAPSSVITQLCLAWANLVEAWTVCATDPHATNPPHDILWSQICAWGWTTDMRHIREGLGHDPSAWALYAAVWDAEAAWLEGSRINGIKGGEQEREDALRILAGTFETKDGAEFGIVRHALEMVQHELGQEDPIAFKDGQRVLKSLARAGNVLASVLRLWLACLPPLDNGAALSAPPFPLPLSDLSSLSATLVKHSIWHLPSKLGAFYMRVYLRPLTRFVAHFHRVSRYIPGTTPQLWLAQALVFQSRLLPGDESHVLAMLDAFSFVIPQFVGADPSRLSRDIHVDLLQPFFEYTVRPNAEVYVAPLQPNVESISRSSTLRLPPSIPPQALESNDGDDRVNVARTLSAGLPLTRDFLFTPLTHLMRSGTSPVFRALPRGWTASEVDVVRATLFLVYAARKVLIAHELSGFAYDAAEVVFGCMRVCMLEHGVGVGVGTGTLGAETDVFRDAVVEQLMAWLLEPYSVRGPRDSHIPVGSRSLEDASKPYLGSTPFYQFYTDLVALYAAVSFGHPMFAVLMVAPLAMRYAVDYRRALWCGEGDAGGSGSGGGVGLGDVVRSVRVPIEDVVCTVGENGDLREYLYPVDRDVGVLGAYVAALVAHDGGGVQGFLRLVAVHHVACTIWDLDPSADAKETTRREEMRARLLRAVLTHGEENVVRDVVLYRQRERGAFVWPPTCYSGGEDESREWRAERLALVRRVIGDGATERVGSLLTAAS